MKMESIVTEKSTNTIENTVEFQMQWKIRIQKEDLNNADSPDTVKKQMNYIMSV